MVWWGIFVEEKYEEQFPIGSHFYSSLRFLHFPEDYLHKAIFHDNRLLCKNCSVQRCKMQTSRLPRQEDSDIYLNRVFCLGFASGVLKYRTGMITPGNIRLKNERKSFHLSGLLWDMTHWRERRISQLWYF